MTSVIIYSIVVLSLTAAILAIVLYVTAQKFQIYEDPRIGEVTEKLPGANCGGCGFAGCKALAEEIVKKGSLEGLLCPVGGLAAMSEIASVMGLEVGESVPKIAVVRCSGSKVNTTSKVKYDGAKDCLGASLTMASEGGCPNGCLGLGNCVAVCAFDAIAIDKDSGLPVVDEDKCTACGNCAKICPRKVIEIRNKGIKDRRVFVGCINKEKGATAKKNCAVACIGCGKCAKACEFDAIAIDNNVAYIDFHKCKLCRKCVAECPTGAIHEVNFPPKKDREVNIELTETNDTKI
ncbi:MAG: RnfABCDGE type electron transport complex subunit B [Bacteroidales bacterium]|jgi:Na+-translocating ferredoxin:NAD+ oxidoreductase RNF subunit RnfB|nr:RnfABCDGE type electron transport complex subunit B [Bacteroidales bacterium]